MTPSLQSQNLHYAASVTSEIHFVGCPSSWPIVFPTMPWKTSLLFCVSLPARRTHVSVSVCVCSPFADMLFSVSQRKQWETSYCPGGMWQKTTGEVCHRLKCLAPMSSQLAPWHTTEWERQVNKKTKKQRCDHKQSCTTANANEDGLSELSLQKFHFLKQDHILHSLLFRYMMIMFVEISWCWFKSSNRGAEPCTDERWGTFQL